MKQSTILQRICPGDWYAKAYSEYLQDVANSVVLFKENISAFITEATEQFDNAGLDPNNDYNVDDFIRDHIGNYPNISLTAMYPFNEGYLSGFDILRSIIKVYCDGSDINEFDENDNLQITSKAGLITDVKLSTSTLLQEISEMIHSSALSAAALKASTFSNLTDKITSFKNTFSSFTQGELNFGNIDVSYFNSLLEATSSSEQFLISWVEATNIDNIAEDDNDLTYQDSMMAQYTGANPALAADFSTVMSTVSTVVATGTKVVKGIFSAVKNLGKSLFNKAKKFLTDTVIDPTFIGYDDNSELENSIDGFLYQGSANLSLMCDNNVAPNFIEAAKWSRNFNSFAYDENFRRNDAIFSKWIKIKTIFGNVMFKIRSDDDGYEYLDYKIQPLLINTNSAIYTNFSTFIDFSNSEYGDADEREYYFEKFSELIDVCFAQYSVADMYPNQSISKSEFISGLNFSLQILVAVVPYILYETIRLVAESLFDNAVFYETGHISARCQNNFTSYGTYQWNTGVEPDSIPSELCTNLYAFRLATGYNSDGVFSNYMPGLMYDDVQGSLVIRNSLHNGNSDVIAVMLFYCYMLARLDRRNNPTNYLFLPFSAGTEDIDHGKWSIKTDDQINDAFNQFIAAAIIVVITVVVLSAAAITFKKIANVRLKKQLETKSRLDSKMWNGEKLTSKEYRKYKKLHKRIDASKILNGSGGSGISLSDSNNAGSVSNDMILLMNKLIIGQE